MDDFEGTDQTPYVSVPVPKIDMEPLANERAADGTRTKIGLGTSKTAVVTASRASQPPPIPTAAFPLASPPDMTPSGLVSLDDSVEVPIDVDVAEPSPQATLTGVPAGPNPTVHVLKVVAELEDEPVTITSEKPTREPTASDAALPPLPAPSREWMRQSSQVVPVVAAAPRAMPPGPKASQRPPLAPRVPTMPIAHEPSAPVQSAPVQSAPVQSAPVQSAPVQSALVQSAVEPSVVVAGAVQSAPVQSAPVQSAPVRLSSPSLGFGEEEAVPTTYFERTAAPRVWNAKLIAGVSIAAIASVSLLAFALRGGSSDDKKSDATLAAKQEEVTPHKRSHAKARVADVEPSAPAAAAPDVTDSDVAPSAPSTAPSTNIAPETEPAKPATTVQIPISSWPAGAIVTLVDNGTTSVIGKTPLIASLDPSRSYDIVLALKDRPTTVKHLDPRTQHDLAVDFDTDKSDKPRRDRTATTEPSRTAHATTEPAKQAPAPRVATAPAPAPHAATTTAPASRTATTSPAPARGTTPAPAPAPRATTQAPAPAPAPRVATAPAPAAKQATPAAPPTPAAKQAAQTVVAPPPPPKKNAKLEALTAAPEATPEVAGTLSVSATPACEIVIDGAPTHMTTPHSIAVAPGSHVITLINKTENIRKSFAVKIEAKHTTKLAQDFTAH